MKVGVNLINFGPGATPDSLRRWLGLSEALGYHLIMTSDHIAITPDVQGRYPAPFYEPLSLLGWMASVTTKMEIGTTVIIVPYRNPVETARALANIDQLSGGRLIFGVGIGWAQGEFDVLKVPFRQRGAITNEYLEAIKLLWTQDVASYQGKHISFQDIHTAPRPVRSPHPPIWVGGPSDAAMRRAARYGDAYHPIRIRMDWFKNEGIPRLKAIADEEGKPMPSLCPRNGSQSRCENFDLCNSKLTVWTKYQLPNSKKEGVEVWHEYPMWNATNWTPKVKGYMTRLPLTEAAQK